MRQEMVGFWDGSGISWTICKQSASRSRQITTPTPHHSIFTGQMLFLTPNQQCQSTKGSSSCDYEQQIFLSWHFKIPTFSAVVASGTCTITAHDWQTTIHQLNYISLYSTPCCIIVLRKVCNYHFTFLQYYMRFLLQPITFIPVCAHFTC